MLFRRYGVQRSARDGAWLLNPGRAQHLGDHVRCDNWSFGKFKAEIHLACDLIEGWDRLQSILGGWKGAGVLDSE